jgi:hypothetical protein
MSDSQCHVMYCNGFGFNAVSGNSRVKRVFVMTVDADPKKITGVHVHGYSNIQESGKDKHGALGS